MVPGDCARRLRAGVQGFVQAEFVEDSLLPFAVADENFRFDKTQRPD